MYIKYIYVYMGIWAYVRERLIYYFDIFLDFFVFAFGCIICICICV